MAVSLNSIVGFNSMKLQVNYQHVSQSSVKVSAFKPSKYASPLWVFVTRRHLKERGWILPNSVVDSDRLASNTGDMGTGDAERSVSDLQVSAVHSSSTDSLEGKGQIGASVGDQRESQASDSTNGLMTSSDLMQGDSSSPKSTKKRSPLTARERLRAARVLGRYTETKASRSGMGSKVLDALRESDKGKKRSGLPEAPTNLFDDSKRGLPKQGLTFQFPGGVDLFFIAFSFVFISTVMFATTYLVWKVGAIHFNEY